MASAVMMIFFASLFGMGFSSPLQQQHQSLNGHPPGNDCKKYTGFHESLLKSSSSLDQSCLYSKPICKYLIYWTGLLAYFIPFRWMHDSHCGGFEEMCPRTCCKCRMCGSYVQGMHNIISMNYPRENE